MQCRVLVLSETIRRRAAAVAHSRIPIVAEVFWTGIAGSAPAGLPELVEAGAADDEGGVHLEAVRAEVRVLKELAEALNVALHAHVGQVRHHVGHHLAQHNESDFKQ